jgi:hypothetical protein
MQKLDIEHDLAALQSALSARVEPTITGGQLFYLMQSVVPNLNFRELVGIHAGPGALTKFAEIHLPSVIRRIGNQGGDILYQMVGRDRQLGEEIGHPPVWKTFVSPSSHYHLVIQVAENCMVARATAALNDSKEIEIDKATVTEHDQIRSEFMDSIPEQDATAISDLVGESCHFAEWIIAVKNHSSETVKKWGLFRREHLLALFNKRIDALDIEEPLRDRLMAQIKASLRATLDKKDAKPYVQPVMGFGTRKVFESPLANTMVDEARILAHAAIGVMGYDELRSIRLPLGVILDSLRAKN